MNSSQAVDVIENHAIVPADAAEREELFAALAVLRLMAMPGGEPLA